MLAALCMQYSKDGRVGLGMRQGFPNLWVSWSPFILESFEEATDYNSTLINQLGIGREKPSTMKDCQESSRNENLDVRVDIQFTTLVNKKEQKTEPQLFSCQSQEVPLLMLQVTKNFCERALYHVMSCKLLQSLDTFKSLSKVLQSSYCLLKCLAVKSVIFTAIQYTRTNYTGGITDTNQSLHV